MHVNIYGVIYPEVKTEVDAIYGKDSSIQSPSWKENSELKLTAAVGWSV